ncbi:ACRO protein, partial [Formicarius rufipectus]|nr:ACRO protein [Formicarius rufipectus]
VRRIQRLLLHEHYVASTARNDIALLELNRPVECSDYIQLGCVPDTSVRVEELKYCYIAGWTFPGDTGEFPSRVCALGELDTLGTGAGDSGGPLVCKDSTADYFWLVGMSSWGRGCDKARHPGIYTSIQHFHNWIMVQTG